jgi:hypothetical protein
MEPGIRTTVAMAADNPEKWRLHRPVPEHREA